MVNVLTSQILHLSLDVADHGAGLGAVIHDTEGVNVKFVFFSLFLFYTFTNK
jgi:hypothetical protein